MKAAAFPICAAACFRGIRRRFSRGGCIFSSSGFSRLVLDLPLAPLTICRHKSFCRLSGIFGRTSCTVLLLGSKWHYMQALKSGELALLCRH